MPINAPWKHFLTVTFSVAMLCFLTSVSDADELNQTRPVEGLRENPPATYALLNATIVVRPGKVIEKGSVIVEGRTIAGVGADVEIPSNARRIDLSGKMIYPGFIDAYAQLEIPKLNDDRQLGHWNSQVQPERRVAESFKRESESYDAYRKQGITVRLLAPMRGIIKGRSAIVTLGSAAPEQNVLDDDAALHVRLAAPRDGARDEFPNSPMGAVALARQAFYDAAWYRDAWRTYHARTDLAPPERNLALEAIQPYVDEQALVILETADEQYLQRAELFAREFGLRVAFVGSGHEYRRLDLVAQCGRWVIVPLNFPKAPNVSTVEAAAAVTLERLMHWDHAPENPARLQAAGVTIAFSSQGLSEPSDFLPALRTVVKRGMTADDALRALTETPARELGIARAVGSIERGKLAHLIVTDSEIFAAESKILQTWVDGEPFMSDEEADVDLRGRWQLTASMTSQNNAHVIQFPPLLLDGTPHELTGKWQLETSDLRPQANENENENENENDEDEDEDEEEEEEEEEEEGNRKSTSKASLKKLAFAASQLSAQFDASVLGLDRGVAQLSLTVVPHRATSNGDDPAAATHQLLGRIVLPDGESISVVGQRGTEGGKEAEAEAEAEANVSASDADALRSKPDAQGSEAVAGGKTDADSDADSDAEAKPSPESAMASFPVNFPLGAYGVARPVARPASVLFREATVWTCGVAGRLEKADVWVERGIVRQVAEKIETVPHDTVIIECNGRHLTPGIIDCHSHIATDGGVNEGTQAITAEVRIGDFIDARDISIYRQLAGGVTTINILHGSANPIGGQNQVIKLRWGVDSEAMKFREAPAGIKFALGENVKQSNWGDRYTSRYPQSRMGVEQLIRDAFLAARQYQVRQQKWQQNRAGLPPRRDLELDALLEIQNGERWIHCHSYRQDEILALLRTLESFGIQIGTLQHVLEGYKVAEVLKQHGAMASSFSDWWAYKIEVLDAIPFNGALMHDRGVVVSFNSDDAELARHLNHEAAKAVKYGGIPEIEALKFVTLNPARQLRIDHLVGSIEVGKHADLAVWSGSPLSGYSRCEQTWVDGRKYFDRAEDLAGRGQWRQQRSALIQKILDVDAPMEKDGEATIDELDLWPRYDIYCGASGRSQRVE